MPPQSALSAAPPATPAAPPTLALERRRWTALFSLPFALVLAINAVLSLRWMPQLLGSRAGWIVGVLAALAGGALAISLGRSGWQALTDAGPALLVDARGITDRFHLHTHVPWGAIRSTSLSYGDGNSLVLTLRPGGMLANGEMVRDTWGRAARRLLNGGDLTIPLGGLVYDPLQLRETLAAHLAHARKSRPANAA
jgi:hypothetical protein